MRNSPWLGNSLQVIASLAERDGLRSKVHCIDFDRPDGTDVDSSLQWGSPSRDVKDGSAAHVMRDPASEFLAVLQAP